MHRIRMTRDMDADQWHIELAASGPRAGLYSRGTTRFQASAACYWHEDLTARLPQHLSLWVSRHESREMRAGGLAPHR